MENLIPVLNYSFFYPGFEVPTDPLSMFDGYDVEILILAIVGIRNSLERNGYRYDTDGAMAIIFGNLPPERSARLKHFLFGNPSYSLIQPAVVDKMLADLFPRLLDQKKTREIQDGQFEQRLLDVILCYNQAHYYNDSFGALTDSHELVWSLSMMQGVSGVSKVDFSRTGPIKHFIMLDFLRKSLGERFNELEQSLKDNTGLENIHYFMGSFLDIFAFLEKQKGKENLVPHIAKNDPLLANLLPLGLVVNHEIVAEGKFDIGQLLARPFFQLSNGSMYVIDHRNFSLLLERTFMYVLYQKTCFAELAGLKNLNGLYAHFGKHYYEKFLINKLLSSMEQKGVRVVPSDDFHLADFTLIIDETDVFVIEVKSVAVHYNTFATQDFIKFREYIQENYCDTKGAAQLARNIAYLKDDRHNLLGITNPDKKLNIYPIIVFTDPKAATQGVNDYVGEISNPGFAELVSAFNKIMPLTMIHSDFFVENSEILARDKTLLKRLVDNYHLTIERNKQRYAKFKSTHNYLISMPAFDRFTIGIEGIYRVPEGRIYLHLGDVFDLKGPRENWKY